MTEESECKKLLHPQDVEKLFIMSPAEIMKDLKNEEDKKLFVSELKKIVDDLKHDKIDGETFKRKTHKEMTKITQRKRKAELYDTYLRMLNVDNTPIKKILENLLKFMDFILYHLTNISLLSDLLDSSNGFEIINNITNSLIIKNKMITDKIENVDLVFKTLIKSDELVGFKDTICGIHEKFSYCILSYLVKMNYYLSSIKKLGLDEHISGEDTTSYSKLYLVQQHDKIRELKDTTKEFDFVVRKFNKE